LAGGEPGGAADALLPVRSLEPASSLAADAAGGSAGASLRGAAPRVIGGRRRYPHATVCKALHRGGCSRPEARSREPARRYDWPCPGDLATPLPATARARQPSGGRLGYDVVHAIVDDHSRFAYAEVLADAKAQTVTGFVRRALAAFAERGNPAAAADERQRLELRQEPLAPRAARPSRNQAPEHEAAAAAHQRQSRTVHPNARARVGLRPRLRQLAAPPPGTATLARPLQRAETAQLTRRPAPISRVQNVCRQAARRCPHSTGPWSPRPSAL
jgi:Integrase core domain